MPSSDPRQRFEDILDNIGRIEGYTAGISEAARKLGVVAEELCPGIAWPEIRALGNFLRHEYDRIERERLWLVVERDLAPLRVAVQLAFDRLTSAWISRSTIEDSPL